MLLRQESLYKIAMQAERLYYVTAVYKLSKYQAKAHGTRHLENVELNFHTILKM